MKLKIIFLAMISAVLPSEISFADDASEEIRALKKQIEELSQKVSALEHKTALNEAAAETKHKETPTVSIGKDGFILRSADTNFALRLFGYGQFDGRFYADSGLANDTFLMRRMRLGVDGKVFQHYDYRVLADLGSGITSTAANNFFLQDAYVNFHYWEPLQLRMGKFKEPISLETLQSDSSLLFAERGLPTLLAPNRDVGIELHGALLDSRLTYEGGIFNGTADNGSGDLETSNSGKHFVARIFAQPFKTMEAEPLRGIAFGVAGSYGDRAETLPGYVTTGRQRFFTYRAGLGTNAATANINARGEQWRVAPQGYYYYGPFGIFGEYILSSVEVRRAAGGAPTSFTVDNDAWNVAASYVLTGEENTYNRVVPRHPFTLSGDGWGAWEIAARYGEFSIDRSAYPLVATPASAQKIMAWEVGLNWYLNKNVKFNLDYSQTHFRGGNGASGSVTAQDEKVFIGRTQFSF